MVDGLKRRMLRREADQAVAIQGDLLLKGVTAQGYPDGCSEIAAVEGFEDEVERPGIQRPKRQVAIADSGHHQDNCVA